MLPALAFSAQTFTGLRVTWDLNPLDTWAFNSMPRDLAHDYMHGFTAKDDQCSTGGSFRGRRYWYKNDPATMLLFDVNGYIAGIQTGVPKTSYTPPAPVNGHPFISDGDYWTLTIYTVDPSIICTTGRSASEYASQGTGTGVWVQNGTDPSMSMQMPQMESGMSGTKWVKGKCFYTMGVHYWYDVSVNMDCNGFFPFFMMYNKGVLNAAGFAINIHLSSKRYEHPPVFAIGSFMQPVPACFANDPNFAKISTEHFYYTDSPRTTCLC
jgi:charged multivesicular body protein 7